MPREREKGKGERDPVTKGVSRVSVNGRLSLGYEPLHTPLPPRERRPLTDPMLSSVSAQLLLTLMADLLLLFFFFFLGYRGIVYSPSARSCRRRQTNLICARTTA